MHPAIELDDPFLVICEDPTMASVHLDTLRGWYREEEHPNWYRRFSTEQRDRMVDEDLTAGYGIPTLLAGIVCVGLTMMAITVLAAL